MSLDEETKKIVLEVMGPNVFKQLTVVESGFFDGKYIVAKLVKKPKEKRPSIIPVTYLEPKVFASTHPVYKVGSILDSLDILSDIIREDYNLSISPIEIRRGMVGKEILEEGPEDGLVIAEISKESEGFGNPRVFYANAAFLSGGCEISSGRLEKTDFFKASSKFYVHFAFVPQKSGKKRESVYIDKAWELKK